MQIQTVILPWLNENQGVGGEENYAWHQPTIKPANSRIRFILHKSTTFHVTFFLLILACPSFSLIMVWNPIYIQGSRASSSNGRFLLWCGNRSDQVFSWKLLGTVRTQIYILVWNIIREPTFKCLLVDTRQGMSIHRAGNTLVSGHQPPLQLRTKILYV